MAISKVVQFINSPEYAHFSRIVFDTAPTGHTLRLLTLPDFLDASLGARSPYLQYTFSCDLILYEDKPRVQWECARTSIMDPMVKMIYVELTCSRGGLSRQDSAAAAEAGGCGRHRQGPVWREEGAGLGRAALGAAAGARRPYILPHRWPCAWEHLRFYHLPCHGMHCDTLCRKHMMTALTC